ncbi:TPA: hypothetical protein ROX79_005055 [Bacillus thuringiensis]|nr:hypothetical protein [Bacillus thuringiensis]
MLYIDINYYKDDYEGISVEDDFLLERLIKRACNQIDILTGFKLKGRDINALPSFIKENVKLAVASQVEYLAINGEHSATIQEGSDSFRIGNYSESGGSKSSSEGRIKYADDVKGYLSYTGLLYNGVDIHG